MASAVTTPSAPSPSWSQLASSPSSEREPGSTRRSTRSRTGSLPCSAVFSWWRCGPPARAASRACDRRIRHGRGAYSECRGASPRGRRAARGRRAGGRAPPARRARPRPGAARSIPGLDPHLVQHRDHVLAGDVAGRARGDRAAAELAEARLEGVDPLLQGGEDVGEALAAGVVEVGGQLDPGQPLAGRGEELAHLARVRHPRRVAEADLGAPGGAEPLGDLEDALGRHLALVRAAEGGRDHALAAQARLPGSGERPLEAHQRLLDRAVDVLAVVGLRGGEEDADLIEAVAHRQGALEAALVGNQDREGDALAALHRGQHLLRVGELGDHVGTHERGHLEPRQARAREQVDQPHLVRRGDRLRLVLEAVAGPDLAQADGFGKVVHRPGA